MAGAELVVEVAVEVGVAVEFEFEFEFEVEVEVDVEVGGVATVLELGAVAGATDWPPQPEETNRKGDRRTQEVVRMGKPLHKHFRASR